MYVQKCTKHIYNITFGGFFFPSVGWLLSVLQEDLSGMVELLRTSVFLSGETLGLEGPLLLHDGLEDGWRKGDGDTVESLEREPTGVQKRPNFG